MTITLRFGGEKLMTLQRPFEISVNNARLVSNTGGLNPLHLAIRTFCPRIHQYVVHYPKRILKRSVFAAEIHVCREAN